MNDASPAVRVGIAAPPFPRVLHQHACTFVVPSTPSLPPLPPLLQDKMLRVMLYDHIVNDIKSINEKGRNPKVCLVFSLGCVYLLVMANVRVR